MWLAVLILVPFAYLAAKAIPPLLTRIAKTQNAELFLLVALSIGIGTAAVTQMAGLSLALGAFLAGLIISGSEYGHETLARLLSLRDAFVALFFVTIGALIDPRVVWANLPLLGLMLGLIIGGKFVIWTLVVRLFRYAWGTAPARGRRSHADRRVFFRVGAGRENRGPRERGCVQCHPGRVVAEYSPQRAPRSVCAGLDRYIAF
ncbi:MAG: cation:proton antiporter [Nitrospira sp.]|nr:cation:proton antiporter [Nitrospira sp.]